MQGLIKISNEIAKQNYPDVEFRLAVRALVPGSLSFDFVALACAAQNLFTSDNMEYAKTNIGDDIHPRNDTLFPRLNAVEECFVLNIGCYVEYRCEDVYHRRCSPCYGNGAGRTPGRKYL